MKRASWKRKNKTSIPMVLSITFLMIATIAMVSLIAMAALTPMTDMAALTPMTAMVAKTFMVFIESKPHTEMRKLLILRSRALAIYSRISTTIPAMTSIMMTIELCMAKMTGLNAAIFMKLLRPNPSADMRATLTNLAGPLGMSLAMEKGPPAMTTLVMV